MIQWWQKVSSQKPWMVLVPSMIGLLLLGWYAAGVFGSLSSGDDGFYATGTEAHHANEILNKEFETAPSSQIILFERKDPSLGEATSSAYQEEISRLLAPLEDKSSVGSITTYRTQNQDNFISNDNTKTYAIISPAADSDDAAYTTIRDFIKTADQTRLKISLGGATATEKQIEENVNRDLTRTEIVTMPILLVLLVVFFRSGIAALIPIGMSIITIVGAFAIARALTGIVPIDHYAINVMTILGVGLSIDYALLSVNRFREELAKGSVERAVSVIVATSGRTIFFSGITVIACLLALLIIPVSFLHSIAIGGVSAVAMGILVTVVILPAVLKIVGKNIDKWRLPLGKPTPAKSQQSWWYRIAYAVTKRPVAATLLGLIVVGVTLVPLGQFTTSAMDYRWAGRDTSSRYVGQVLNNEFGIASPAITGVLAFDQDMPFQERLSASCGITQKIQEVSGVKDVISITPLSSLSCEQIKQLHAAGLAPQSLRSLVMDYSTDNALRFDVVLDNSIGSPKADQTLLDIRRLAVEQGVWHVGGMQADEYDTRQAYMSSLPWAIGAIAISMVILLSLLLRSIVLPLQAIVINTIALAISLSVIICIFQLGWLDALTGWGTTNGLVIAAPVLVMAIAFGLAMDYSVFLYSRMRESYDKSGDPIEAIKDGVAKTGPIITAAALVLFVVVAAFGFSSVPFMQIIGIGLAVAVMVDAFFVRLVFVPAIMALMKKSSWYAPKWLSKWEIRHE